MKGRSRYVSWLIEQGRPVFEAGGVDWIAYRGSLVPANPATTFVDVPVNEAEDLLRTQGARLIRWSTGPVTEPSEWWHVLCDNYSPSDLSSRARRDVKRGLRDNTVRRLSASQLASDGYRSYRLAFERYKGARPISEEAFKADAQAKADGPFEIWGVFSGDELDGYLVAVVEGRYVAMTSQRITPKALKRYAAYALNSVILSEYVSDRGMTVTNGARAVAHRTQMQQFVLKLGFEKSYGSLRIIYSPGFRMLAMGARAFGPVAGLLPGRAPALIYGLGFQESIRRKTSTLATFS
jgi:hypothetical protein